MLEAATILMLAAHLLCVNVATGGPLIGLWLEWRGSRGDQDADRAGRYLAGASALALLAGAILGGALLALVWNDSLHAAMLGRLRRKVLFGGWELLFSLVLSMATWIWWARSRRPAGARRLARASLSLLSGTNLLYHFPLLFIVLTQVAESAPDGPPISAGEFRRLIVAGDVPARATHFAIASLAVGGVLLMGAGRRFQRQGIESRVGIQGARLALGATLLQVPVGIWLVTQLPPGEVSAVMGDDLAATGMFGLALLASLALLHQLAAAAFGETGARTVRRAMLLLLVVVCLMTGVSRRIRLQTEDAPAAMDGV